jgi:hypothetical protein
MFKGGFGAVLLREPVVTDEALSRLYSQKIELYRLIHTYMHSGLAFFKAPLTELT